MAKADDGFSNLSMAPDRVSQFFNNLEIVKGQPATAQEAEGFAETMKSGSEVPIAPMVVKNITDLKIGFTPATVSAFALTTELR